MIEIKGLSKKYKNFLLNHASFSLPDGKIVGLIGSNGVGKSTIIRIMAGLEEKTDGEILVDGVPVSNVGEALRVGFISQNLEIYIEQKMSEIVKQEQEGIVKYKKNEVESKNLRISLTIPN